MSDNPLNLAPDTVVELYHAHQNTLSFEDSFWVWMSIVNYEEAVQILLSAKAGAYVPTPSRNPLDEE